MGGRQRQALNMAIARIASGARATQRMVISFFISPPLER
jgi:hypothetical protein